MRLEPASVDIVEEYGEGLGAVEARWWFYALGLILVLLAGLAAPQLRGQRARRVVPALLFVACLAAGVVGAWSLARYLLGTGRRLA